MKTLYFEINYGRDQKKKPKINIGTVLADLKLVLLLGFCIPMSSIYFLFLYSSHLRGEFQFSNPKWPADVSPFTQEVDSDPNLRYFFKKN